MAIRYARSGTAHIAYDTLGSGPIDLLHISSGMMVPIDSLDEEPRVARYYRRLASFARVILFDSRGLGRSDPLDPQRPNTTASAADDALAVLDAVESVTAAVVAWFGGGPIAIELAAAHPERVSSLVLGDSYARLIEDDDYPLGIPRVQIEAFLHENLDPDTPWTFDGGTDDVTLLAPSMASDVRFRDWVLRAAARAASPAAARTHQTMICHADVRELLPSITVPTLVLHRERNQFTPRRFGRYLAEHPRGRQVRHGSRTVCDVVTGSGLVLESRGEFELKGVPQRWELFAAQR